ncbi:conserved hypothetical protein [Tenacibaculum sp. 190524A05c]|uniref:hypothetical protein n=1 Tax=Tenacibaculum platacis TaxID=3137852 RepID=UPI0031FAAF32
MKFFKSLTTLVVLIILSSCSEETPNSGRISLTARNSSNSVAAKSTVNQQVSIDQIKLNVSNFELELDSQISDNQNDNWDDNGTFDSQDEVELKGPFVLNLSSGDVNVLATEVPNATFEEIEFQFEVNQDQNSEMFNKSIEISGTLNSVPFVFWHNFEDKVDIDFEDKQKDIVINNGLNSLVLNFDLSVLFDGEDLSLITDTNQDGKIEISPTDADGNNVLANKLKDKIKMLVHLLND